MNDLVLSTGDAWGIVVTGTGFTAVGCWLFWLSRHVQGGTYAFRKARSQEERYGCVAFAAVGAGILAYGVPPLVVSDRNVPMVHHVVLAIMWSCIAVGFVFFLMALSASNRAEVARTSRD